MSARPGARLFILIIVGLIALPLAASAKNSDDPNAPSAKQAQKILKENRPLANNGDASAQYNMGVLYDQGYGVKQDFAKARQWYEKAAAQHYGRAEHNLGIMYEAGKGMPRDPGKAAHWFRRGADDGQAASQNNLAVLYMKGSGVPQNTGKAAFWTARAAAAGNSAAIGNLPRITADLPHIHVNADDVNVRDQPNREARIVRHVDSDTVVVVLAHRQDWTQILVPKSYSTGWVANFLLSDSQAPLASEASPEDNNTASDEAAGSSAMAPESTDTAHASEARPQSAPSRQTSPPGSAPQSAATPSLPPAKHDQATPNPTKPAKPMPPMIVRSQVPPPNRPPDSATGSRSASSPAPEPDKPAKARSAPSRKAGSSADTTPSKQAASGGTARVGVGAANFRSKPSGGARVIGQLHRGDKVRLLDERNGWRYVRTSEGLKGWVAGYLLVIP